MKKQVDVSIVTCNEFFKLLKNCLLRADCYFRCIEAPPEKVFHFDSTKFRTVLFSHSLKEKSQNNSLKPFCFSLENWVYIYATKYEKNVI